MSQASCVEAFCLAQGEAWQVLFQSGLWATVQCGRRKKTQLAEVLSSKDEPFSFTVIEDLCQIPSGT